MASPPPLAANRFLFSYRLKHERRYIDMTILLLILKIKFNMLLVFVAW